MARRVELQVSIREGAKTATISGQLFLDRTQVSVARANFRTSVRYPVVLDSARLNELCRALMWALEEMQPTLFEG